MQSLQIQAQILCLILGLLVFNERTFAQTSAVDELKKANDLYQAGDCKQALPHFTSAQKKSDLTTDDMQTLLFRKSYCSLNLEDNEAASAGFNEFLKKNPDHQEAKLRLAQAELNLSHFSHARELAESINSSLFKNEARVFVARASLELNDPERALRALSEVQDPGDWGPVFGYWQAVAYYNKGDTSDAVNSFKAAQSRANKDSWVRKESQDWLERIKDESRWIHGYLTIGQLSDSNIAQNGTANIFGAEPSSGPSQGPGGPGGQGGPGGEQGGPGGPPSNGPGGPPQGPGAPGGGQNGPGSGRPPTAGSSTSIKDSGHWLAAGFTLTPYYRSTGNVYTSVAYSSPYYSSTYKSYDYQTLNFETQANFATSTGNWWGGKIDVLATWYNYLPNETYLLLNTYYAWNARRDLTVRFDLTGNDYLKTKTSHTITPGVAAYYSVLRWLTLRSGLSYTSGTGKAAAYNHQTPPEVVSGNAFSNYTSFGPMVGLSVQLPLNLNLSAQIANYKTSYDHEDRTDAGEPSRSDNLTQTNIDLNFPLIRNLWSLDLSATISNNASTGQQDISTAGSITTYAYNRNYYLLSTTVSF